MALISLTVTSQAPAAALRTDPIKIGAIVSLTGFAVEDGKQYSRAINLALDEIGWKIGDRKIELIIEDDAYNPTVAVQKIKKLSYSDKAKIVIGPQYTASALAIHPFIRDNKILTINLMAATDQLNTGANFVKNWFRVSFCKQISNVAGYAAYKKGYGKAAIAVPDFVTGHEEAAGFKKVFEKVGGKVIQEIRVPLGSIDMVPYLMRIDPNANVIYAFFFGEDAPRFIKQYVEYGLNKRIPLLAHGATVDLPYLKAPGEAVLGVESIYFYCENSNIPEMVRFRKAFLDKNRVDVSYAAEAGYMAARVLILGLQAVKGDDENIDNLAAAIEKLDFASTRGRFRFGPEHNPVQDYYLRRVEKVDGRYENVVKDVYPNIYQDWMP
jgi:branched-chain amino acid transport system substrate-binding protein